MTDEEFKALVLRLARKRGLPIKTWSIGYVVGTVRGEGDIPSEAVIGERLDEMARVRKDDFDLPEAKPTQTRRERACDDLERWNEHQHATRPEKVPQKMKLNTEQKQRGKQWGPNYLLDLANNATLPEFVTPENDDE